MNKKTLGEQRVRTDFNPSNHDIVSLIKQKTAELINLVQELHDEESTIQDVKTEEPQELKRFNPEKPRLIDLASTAFEEGAMWAVKAATYKPED